MVKSKPDPKDFDWIRRLLDGQVIDEIRSPHISAKVCSLSDQPFGHTKSGEECITLDVYYGKLEIPFYCFKEIRFREKKVTLYFQ